MWCMNLAVMSIRDGPHVERPRWARPLGRSLPHDPYGISRALGRFFNPMVPRNSEIKICLDSWSISMLHFCPLRGACDWGAPGLYAANVIRVTFVSPVGENRFVGSERHPRTMAPSKQRAAAL